MRYKYCICEEVFPSSDDLKYRRVRRFEIGRFCGWVLHGKVATMDERVGKGLILSGRST